MTPSEKPLGDFVFFDEPTVFPDWDEIPRLPALPPSVHVLSLPSGPNVVWFPGDDEPPDDDCR